MGDSKKVLITGFGPFSGLESNPSWEGVNSMSKDDIESKYNITLFREKIDVLYDIVNESVPELWKKLQPDLTIHVGVKETNCFVLETRACKDGYVISDETGTCPADNVHSVDGPDSICTDLDVDLMRKEFNGAPPEELSADTSSNAGRFLCEYTYYTSLAYRGNSKTLFVHIPWAAYSTEQIAQGLERILESCLAQIRKN